jgi:ubiquinone/menaquinone biosynthesis C-methylase UbiE
MTDSNKSYLTQHVDLDDRDLVSVIDDLPLWSAPFGLKLLEMIKMHPGMTVLDIGCGAGFPAFEIAGRLGGSSRVFAMDPWDRALERAELKKRVYGVANLELVKGNAEEMPFDDDYFDLIVSNNGINNVEDMKRTISECQRVARPGAQMVATFNLEETMIEFYSVFREMLARNKLHDSIRRMERHIYEKRKPLEEVEVIFEKSGFVIANIDHDAFKLRFVDGTSMLNFYLIRYWFIDGWKTVVEEADLARVFDQVEERLNEKAKEKGELVLTVPFATVDCRAN